MAVEFFKLEKLLRKREQDLRITVYFFLVAFVFFILVSRLFYLQIIHNQQFKQLSESNRLRLIQIPARRGDILDSKGRVIATSVPVFSISITPSEDLDLEKVAEKLADIIDESEITPEKIIETVKKQPRRYEPVEIARLKWGEKVWEIMARIEENRKELPGVSIEEQPLRYYPHGELLGNILGYVGKISEDELEKYSMYKYSMQDWIGKTGIERFAELIRYKDGRIIGLKGQDGVRQIEVDANNRKIQELVSISPTPGYDVVLTIDLDLQQALEKAMDEVIADVKKANPKAMAGGAVVLDVRTGKILAAASRPAVNPNDFVDGSFSEKRDYYNDPKKRPLYNRVFQATYPPGSTFKMVTAMAALEKGVNPQDSVICRGAYWRPPHIKCWDVHGRVNLYSALAKSCNTYFQEAGRRAGIDKIVEIAKEFGLGEKTNTLGILNESSGILPSPQWKKKQYQSIIENKYKAELDALKEEYDSMLEKADSAEEQEEIKQEYESRRKILESQYEIDLNFYTKWQPFDTYNTSIGQGSNNYTIIQLANYVATIANGGKRYRPYLIEKVVSPEGRVVLEYKPELINKVKVSDEILAHVRRGMKAVTEPGGTAYFLFSDFPANIGVGAKSGTAQTGRSGDRKDKDFHGVFVAFAPYDNPQIAFACIIEYGESGGSSAGRVAKAVFEEYFGLNDKEKEEREDMS
ncbi:MAG TPA: penicillin-binding protein 2 [Peptococcaceae bacterium]|nr:MAG: Peptidoglycan glycosyltransferase [Clostridia bacterium 41_269]HBT20407.1 penicillin-binding protein 2 [Peptococcaceae bacterium]